MKQTSQAPSALELLQRCTPHLQRGAACLWASRRHAGAGAAAVWRHRRATAALLTRGFWWAALILILMAGRELLDLRVPLSDDDLVTTFMGGAVLCAAVVILAAERRLRWAGWVLGTAHGSLALLAWTALSA